MFGGTFDPVHLGHLKLAGELVTLAGGALIVPAYRSPFKPEGGETAAAHRLNMCRIAFSGMAGAEVSAFEADSGRAVPTFETLLHFESLTGGAVDLAVGSDSLYTLSSWARPDILGKRRIFVMPRPGFIAQIDGKIAEFKRLYGGEFIMLPPSDRDLSSSEIRAAIAFGAAEEYMPRGVAEYIKEHGLYTGYSHIARGLRALGITEARLKHTLGTAAAAADLAARFNESSQKAVTAALLHDCAKALIGNEEGQKELNIPAEIRALKEPLFHAAAGAFLAADYFKVSDPEIISAVECHTTGKTGMNKLDKIIYAADYIERGRVFNGIEGIRALAERDLDACVIAIMENTISYLTAKCRAVDPRTSAALAEIKEKQIKEI